MKLGHVGVVYRKELRDTLRDRRTLINSFLVPLLAFPLLIVGISVIAVAVVSRATEKDLRVMLLNESEAPEVSSRLRRELRLEMVAPANDYAQRINDKQLQVAVEFPAAMEQNLRENPGAAQTVKLYDYEGELRSQAAARAVAEVIEQYAGEVVAARLEASGLGLRRDPAGQPAVLEPFLIKRQNAASAERVTGNVIGFLLPYFVIILSLTGAMYPALDLTAGEKERGTMETILASPVGRGELAAGKFLLTLTFSLATTTLSVLSMALTVLWGAVLLPASVKINFVVAVSGKALAAVVFLLLPVTILFAAALMAIAVYARNYREGQSYIGPLMFVVILPALASMVPGIELNPRLALVPVLNISLAARDILAGVYPWKLIALIFTSTAAYAAAALWLVRRQFHREEVLFRT